MGKINESLREGQNRGKEMYLTSCFFFMDAYLGMVITVMKNTKRYSEHTV